MKYAKTSASAKRDRPLGSITPRQRQDDSRDLTIKYSYDSAPTIARWSVDRKPMLRGLMGPFGSGKSAGCTIELINLASLQHRQYDGIKRAKFAVIRNTYRELQDTTIRTIKQWLPDGPGGFGTFHETDLAYYITNIPGLEIEMMFRALDRPDQVKNLLSLELTAAWVNEAKEVPWPIIEALIGRVGRYPQKSLGGAANPCILMDTNPPDTDSWWYKKFEEFNEDETSEARNDRVIYKQPSGLSPAAENLPNLPENYYQRLAANMGKEARKVYVEGQYGFLVDGKPVYGDYVDDMHCQEFPTESLYRVDRIYRGWDFGLTPACILSALVAGQWRTFHEFTTETAQTLDFRTFAEHVLAETSRLYSFIRQNKIPFEDIGDPAGIARSSAASNSEEASCFAIARGLGIDMLPGDQALKIRLDSTTYALTQQRGGKPLLLVHPRCTKLRKGYQGRYQYRKLKVAGADKWTELPDKNEYSHVHDANQYIAARLFKDMLLSREEHRQRWKKPIVYPHGTGIVGTRTR